MIEIINMKRWTHHSRLQTSNHLCVIHHLPMQPPVFNTPQPPVLERHL